MKMVLLVIAVLSAVNLCLVLIAYRQNKKIKSIDEGLKEIINNRNHISRIEQGEIERTGKVNRDLINILAAEMDKKVKPVFIDTHYGGVSMFPNRYELVDLAEDEKKAKKLRKELRELEGLS